MRTQNQTAAQALNSSRPEQKIEVVMQHRDGEECLALRLSTWTDGLGWCAQKTIELEVDQLDELHRAVTVARRRLASKRAESDQPVAAAKVIHMPTIA
ncbi:MAG TPA: hypothetical protein VK421_13480 [Pyrinomonadaceae bacterium]|nr:hypothetical protein [Pyrinomonadaceae bacterium]